MKEVFSLRTRLAAALAALTALVCALTPAAARMEAVRGQAAVAAFAKNGLVSQCISFSQEDFVLTGDSQGVSLSSIVLTQLPAGEAGVLELSGRPLATGEQVAASQLADLTFRIFGGCALEQTSLTFRPTFSDGSTGEETQVDLHLLTSSNTAPIAQNLEMNTYKNVAIQGTLTAIDPDGDAVTFRITDPPARGAVTLADPASGAFTYTPYENKTGKDTFSYVAVDSVGNLSNVATVRVKIEKADTKVTYADLEGHPAHRAAIRLAEAGVFTGTCVDGVYRFDPDTPVTREEFLAMSMAAGGVDSLGEVAVTGFYDDGAIPAWAKGYVSAALLEGLVQGTTDAQGQAVFLPQETITGAEAVVLVDRVLSLADVSVSESVMAGDESAPAWAVQAAANVQAAQVLPAGLPLSGGLTRADAAQLLCAMLDYLDSL